MNKRQLLLPTLLLSSFISVAQVAINTDNANPDASAMLDIKSTSKGMLVPRMTTALRTAIASPATGLLVYDTDLNKFYYYNGSTWGDVSAAKFVADADGNTSVHTETNTNEDIIRFKTAGSERWRMAGDRIENVNLGRHVFIGKNTGLSVGSFASAEVFIGEDAGKATTTGSNNVFIGTDAGKANTSGSNNVFLGKDAGKVATTASNNIFLGTSAGAANTTGYDNVFLGKDAGKATTNAYGNLFLGAGAGITNTTGYANVFLGYSAGSANTEANLNTFVGGYAGSANTIGNENTFIGNGAGLSNTSGYYNTFVGLNAGVYNTTGNFNDFFGNRAGASNTTGSENTFLGRYCGQINTTGTKNTFVGNFSGHKNTTGINNTFIGHTAGSPIDITVNNSLAIGYSASVLTDNTIVMGSSSISSATVPVAWTVASDARFKTNVQNNVKGIEFIRLLRPVTYHYNVNALSKYLKEDERMDSATQKPIMVTPDAFTLASREAKSRILQTGFIAQEVESAAKQLHYDFSGVDKPKTADGIYGLRYAEFTVPLVKAVQDLDAENQKLQKQIQQQATELTDLKKQVEQLTKMMLQQTASNK